jgi:hypothetical protein
MRTEIVDLLPDEYEALLEIIRQTLRSRAADENLVLSRCSSYQSNPRMCVRLLEVLNPKRQIPFQKFIRLQAAR